MSQSKFIKVTVARVPVMENHRMGELTEGCWVWFKGGNIGLEGCYFLPLVSEAICGTVLKIELSALLCMH